MVVDPSTGQASQPTVGITTEKLLFYCLLKLSNFLHRLTFIYIRTLSVGWAERGKIAILILFCLLLNNHIPGQLVDSCTFSVWVLLNRKTATSFGDAVLFKQ